jgi:hypothetical protein
MISLYYFNPSSALMKLKKQRPPALTTMTLILIASTLIFITDNNGKILDATYIESSVYFPYLPGGGEDSSSDVEYTQEPYLQRNDNINADIILYHMPLLCHDDISADI